MDERAETQKLHAAIQDGMLTPAEGEARARELGIEPLNQDPDASAFDPFIDAWWSLPMAVEWILERSTEAVVRRWSPFTEKCYHWTKGDLGHFLKQERPPSFAVMSAASKYRAAWADLLSHLADGSVIARGILRSERRRVLVQTSHWDSLKASQKDDDNYSTVFVSAEDQLEYDKVQVRQKDITRNWPRKLTPSELASKPEEDIDGTYSLWGATCLFALHDPEGRPQINAFDDALKRLRLCMSLGQIVVTGVPRSGTRETISKEHWETARLKGTSNNRRMHQIDFFPEENEDDDDPDEKGFFGTLTLVPDITGGIPTWTKIKLNAGEVRALCAIQEPAPEQPSRPTNKVGGAATACIPTAVAKKSKISPQRDAAERAIETLYGDAGVPRDVTNATVVDAVTKYYNDKNNALPAHRRTQVPSLESILRGAGRKK